MIESTPSAPPAQQRLSSHVEWTEARVENHELNLREFEQRATLLHSLPRVLFVELTENCNLSCPMCRSAGKFDRSRNMSQELFDRIARELFPTAEIVDLRGWGESTILKNFPRFVDQTLDYGCRVRMVTNLTAFHEATWRKLVRSGALISVSFDAGERETFGKVRRGADMNVVLRNLEVLVDEAHASGVGTGNIHLNVTVQPAALDELTTIAKHAARLGVGMHLSPITLPDGHPDQLLNHRPDVLRALAELAEVTESTEVDVQLNTALDELWADDDTANKTCTHPWMYLYVNYRGGVGFCDHLIGSPAEHHLVGDLNTSGVREIWNNEQYLSLRAQHGAGREHIDPKFEDCRWCYRNRYLDFDHESYQPYEKHRTRLTRSLCASFVPGPAIAPPGSRLLPLSVHPAPAAEGDQ
ncbi:radical SAM protein [Kitasatospora sp. HPMI-4]|uniref:radical SAM protein n=1 Tax=Kitasatospora sp. HPMI-4 TaxID=3448443 RepID=UPI003F1C6B3F